MKKYSLLAAVLLALTACGGESSEQVIDKPVQEIQASQPNNTVAQPVVATLNLDWETFRRRINEDFRTMEFDAHIPSSIKPEGGENTVRNIAMLPFNDHLFANIAEDPASKKLTSITVNVGPSENSAENLRNFSAAALMLSAAAGDDGNMKTGGKVLEMTVNALQKFAKAEKKSKKGTADVKEQFVADGVKYSVLISTVLPAVMVFAEPDKPEEKTTENN